MRSSSSVVASRFPCLIKRTSFLGVGVLCGCLSRRGHQSRKLDPGLPWLAFDELDQELPLVAVVEEESHLGSGGRERVDDSRLLDTASRALAIFHIDEQLVPDRRIVDVSLELAVEAECVIEIEIKACDYRLRELIEGDGVGDLKCTMRLGPE